MFGKVRVEPKHVGQYILAPRYIRDEEKFSKVPKNLVAPWEYRRPRNVKHNSKFFVKMGFVIEHWPDGLKLKPYDEDDLLEITKAALNLVRRRLLPDGRMIMTTKSISFREMDETAFSDFEERAEELWTRWTGIDFSQFHE